MKSAKGQALPPLDQERNYSHSADTSKYPYQLELF